MGSSSSKSPFAAAAGPKLSGFASPPSSTGPTSSFGALVSSSNKSLFGNTTTTSTTTSKISANLGQSAFGGLGGVNSNLSSFATPGTSTITGLSQKPAKPFGAAEEEDRDEDDEDGDDEAGSDDEETGKSKSIEVVKPFKVQECKFPHFTL